MDRILDSGSNDWGSTPHGCTTRAASPSFLLSEYQTIINRLDAAVLNAKIQKKYQEMISLASKEGFSIKNVNPVELGKISLCDWIEERINKRTDIGAQTRKLHMGMLRSLRKCGLFNTFSDLTPKNLKLWDDEIRTHVTMQTSVYNYHKHLKPYIKTAMQLDYIASNPYDKFKIFKNC